MSVSKKVICCMAGAYAIISVSCSNGNEIYNEESSSSDLHFSSSEEHSSSSELHSSSSEPYYYNDNFIAHAGGSIEDIYIYTNSLEALNLFYSRGCKLFELDIIETSDGKLVAAHDWENYKWQTDYSGDIPLTEQEFLSQKIYGKFTPLNMEMINEWFISHPDAILVTDKINNPWEMLEQFIPRDRLIMELYSWDAVEEAINYGIKAMPNGNLVLSTPNVEQLLFDLDYMSINISLVEENREFLEKVKEKGIKIYAYVVNENELLNDKMDIIYGIYSDNIDLLRYWEQVEQ